LSLELFDLLPRLQSYFQPKRQGAKWSGRFEAAVEEAVDGCHLGSLDEKEWIFLRGSLYCFPEQSYRPSKSKVLFWDARKSGLHQSITVENTSTYYVEKN
jgi:hypothetical protein